jgi:diguanylate cyclase (GGDEF)-like protein/PAS domain S-box-containing protein
LFIAGHRGYSTADLAHLTKKRNYGEGLSALPLESGEALIIEDINTDPRYGTRTGFARRIGVRSFIYFPLRAKGKISGDIVVHYETPHTYSPEEVQLFIAIGHLIGAAIENARSYREKMEEIAERKRAEEALKESEAKYYDLYDHAPDMYYSLDLGTATIRECNETFIRTTGYRKEEIVGRPIFELYDSGSADDAKKSFRQFSATGEIHDAERRVKCKDGRIIDVSLNVSAMRDKDGNITYSRSIWRDITKRKEQAELIRALSITDQLTGLYNRRGFMTLAEQQLRVAERTKNGLLLLYADLDGLKQINDTLGHKSGDEAIVETAQVLKEVFRKMDIIARMGGDEFAILAPEVSLEYSDMITNRLQDQLLIRSSPAGRNYHLSLSIGMIFHDPSTITSLDELISRADSLMYEQKRHKVAFKLKEGTG